ncbi:hypothetical protein ACFHYQ_13115 [Sphaerimonospora cavernae]|uniref:DUF4239 domain-containing protein n=1 Tax=Sphaerimonospora cavernae TaxID=1740611 RepID=A0ABV6U459_9ACTN
MLVCAFAVVTAVGLVALAAFLSRRFGHGADDTDPGGASAGHAGAMLSSLFLLVFAIAIVVPWTVADSARQNTYAEAQAAVETYWSAAGLPAPASGQVQQQVRDYVGFIVDKEWPLMAAGRLSPQSAVRLETLRASVAALRVTADEEREARSAVLDRLTELSGARRQRAADAAATLPPAVLILTIVTGAVIIVFPFLAGARPKGAALLPLIAMTVLLAVGVYLTWHISHAFTGGLAVGPEAFTGALRELQSAGGR